MMDDRILSDLNSVRYLIEPIELLLREYPVEEFSPLEQETALRFNELHNEATILLNEVEITIGSPTEAREPSIEVMEALTKALNTLRDTASKATEIPAAQIIEKVQSGFEDIDRFLGSVRGEGRIRGKKPPPSNPK